MIESTLKEKKTNICIGLLLWMGAGSTNLSYVLITRVHHLKIPKSSWNVDFVPKPLDLHMMKYLWWMLHTDKLCMLNCVLLNIRNAITLVGELSNQWSRKKKEKKKKKKCQCSRPVVKTNSFASNWLPSIHQDARWV